MEVTPCAHPLITAKPYPARGGRRVMPWEVLCLVPRHDPVTTEPERVRLRTLSHLGLTIVLWQIYGRSNTRALDATAPHSSRRTSPDTSTVRDVSRSRSRPGAHCASDG